MLRAEGSRQETGLLSAYNFTSHYLSLPCGRLHYLDEGDGEAVLLVHGNPTWSYYYRNLVPCLSPKFRVIAPDHLGCGLSDKPQDFSYTLENHIANLADLLAQLNIRRVSMVVHDWGGAIGLGVAAAGRIDLDKLVVLNTAAFRSTRMPFRIRICRWPVFGKLLVRGLNGFAGAAVFMAVSKKMEPQVKSGYLQPYDSWNNRVAIHEFVKDIPLVQGHRSYRALVRIEEYLDKLAQSNMPVLILWGGRDFCFDEHFYQEWISRFPDSEKHYFAEWGHYVLEDGRTIIEPIIEKFLSPRLTIAK